MNGQYMLGYDGYLGVGNENYCGFPSVPAKSNKAARRGKKTKQVAARRARRKQYRKQKNI